MLNSLDLLVIVGLALAVAGLLSVCLMFLVKNRRFRQICLYFAAALGVYIGTVGLRILWLDYPGQASVSAVLMLGCVGAVVLERLSKGDEKKFLLARILAAVGVVLGFIVALCI